MIKIQRINKIIAALLTAAEIFSAAFGIFYGVTSKIISPYYPVINALLAAEISPEELSYALDLAAEYDNTASSVLNINSKAEELLGAEKCGVFLYYLYSAKPPRKTTPFNALLYMRRADITRHINDLKRLKIGDGLNDIFEFSDVFKDISEKDWISCVNAYFNANRYFSAFSPEKLTELEDIITRTAASSDFFAEISYKDMLKAANAAGGLILNFDAAELCGVIKIISRFIGEPASDYIDYLESAPVFINACAEILVNLSVISVTDIVENYPHIEYMFIETCKKFCETESFNADLDVLSGELDVLADKILTNRQKTNPFAKGEAVIFIKNCALLSGKSLTETEEAEIKEILLLFFSEE